MIQSELSRQKLLHSKRLIEVHLGFLKKTTRRTKTRFSGVMEPRLSSLKHHLWWQHHAGMERLVSIGRKLQRSIVLNQSA